MRLFDKLKQEIKRRHSCGFTNFKFDTMLFLKKSLITNYSLFKENFIGQQKKVLRFESWICINKNEKCIVVLKIYRIKKYRPH